MEEALGKRSSRPASIDSMAGRRVRAARSRSVLCLGAVVAVCTAGVGVSAALDATAMSRVERIRETRLADGVLNQFTPASGDPRLIARYKAMTANARASFSFTPALADAGESRRAMTVVVRAPTRTENALPRAARSIADAAPAAAPAIAIAPVAYRLGPKVGLNKFANATPARKVDISALPQAPSAGAAPRPRFETRMSVEEPTAGNTARNFATPDSRVVDVSSSYRLNRKIDLTAGVRYRDGGVEARVPQAADSRSDDQAVYVGTRFRF